MLQWLSAALMLPATEAVMSKWTPYQPYGAIDICFDASDCRGDNLQFFLGGLEEFDANGSPTAHRISSFGEKNAFAFNERVNMTEGADIVYNTASFGAAFAADFSSPPHQQPANDGETSLDCIVTQFTSGVSTQMIGLYDVLVVPGALQITYVISEWSFKDPSNCLRLSLNVFVQTDHIFSAFNMDAHVFSVTTDVLRVYLGGGIYLNVPVTAHDDQSSEVPVRFDITRAPHSNYFTITLDFPSSSLIHYALLISTDQYDLAAINALTSTNPSTPDPALAQTRALDEPFVTMPPNETWAPTWGPNETWAPTWGPNETWTPEPTPAPTPYEEPTTQLTFMDGGFEFCYASDCNLDDGVITFTLDRFFMAPYITDNGDVDGEALSDFAFPEEPLTFSTTLEDEVMYSGYLLMGVPYESGGASLLTEEEFISNSTDVIHIGLEVDHLLADNSIEFYKSNLDAPKGACEVMVGFYSVSETSRLAYDGAALTFAISAFHNSQPIMDVTIEDSDDKKFLRLGESEMYMVLPTEIMMGDEIKNVTISAKGYTSGDYAGLIVLTMLFEQINGTVVGTKSLLTSNNMADTTTPISTKSSAWDPPTTSSDGRPLPTKMLVLSNGQFGLCFDPTCDTSKAVKMGFTGLGSPQDTTTVLSRFANAPGFQFGQPKRVVNGSIEIWQTSFYSLVPRSRIRPPMPYTAASAAMDPNTPAFGVAVGQYLTHGDTHNGNQAVSIPRGGLKFGLNITRWPFASPLQTLVLNVTLGNITEGAPFTGASTFMHSSDSANMSKIGFSGDQFLQMPLLAVIDGAMKAIQIGVSVNPSVGITFSLTFPAFSRSLVYDPVLASQALVTMDDNVTNNTNSRIRLRGNGNSSMVISTAAAIVMLSFLGLSIVAGIIRCAHRTPMRKLDFSKVIP